MEKTIYKTENSKPYLNDKLDYDVITIIRTIAVILVILIQHSLAPYSTAWHFINKVQTPILIFYGIISTTFNNVTMPLLIFISGYLYQSLYKEKKKYNNYLELIQKKLKRLIIPAFLFGFIFFLTLTPYQSKPLQTITNGYIHLWYLPALFWCFVFAPLLLKVKNKIYTSLILFLSFLLIYIPFPEILGLNHFHVYFFWFLLGGEIANHKKTFMNFCLNKKLILLFFVIATICLILLILFDNNGYTEQPLITSTLFNFKILAIIRNLYRFSCLISFFLLTEYLVQIGKINIGNKLFFLAKTSFGVYIFHMWIMWSIFKNNYLSSFLVPFAKEHYFLFPILYFMFSFILATIITVYLQKTKIGKFLLG